MKGLLEIEVISELISNSDVKNPREALTKPFFLGIKNVCQPALTKNSVQKRMKDEMFCQYCFEYDKHDYHCRNSGWGEYLKPNSEERGFGVLDKNK